MSHIRKPRPVEAGVLTTFLDELPEEVREKFLRTISQDELLFFSASEDEFRLVSGEEMDTMAMFNKPGSNQEAQVDPDLREKLEERLAEIMEAFPENKSIEGLKKLANDPPGPKSPFRSTDDLREKSEPSVKITISIGALRDKANKG